MFALIGAAWAAPVVHDGDPSAAVAAVAARGGPSVEPVSFDSLRAGPPVLVAGGATASCPGPAADLVDVAVTKAEGALLYGRFDEAAARLDDARAAVLCGATDPPVATLAKIELLAGLALEESGATDQARERYRHALAYDRAVRWPATYPAERRAVFDAESAAFTPATTALAVRPSSPPATVDGAALGSDAPTGEHVVRVGPVAVRVHLDEAPNRLVVPAAFPPDALGWMADDARRPELSALFAVGLGEGAELWVVHGDTAWRGVAGRSDWTRFDPPSLPAPMPVPDPVVAPVPARRGRAGAWALTITGVAAGLAGGGASWLGASRATDAVEHALDPGAYDRELERFEDAVVLRNVGLGFVAAGGVLTVGGVAWGLR